MPRLVFTARGIFVIKKPGSMEFMLPGKNSVFWTCFFVLAYRTKNTAIFCETMSKFANKTQCF